jgi:hypothetical protein
MLESCSTLIKISSLHSREEIRGTMDIKRVALNSMAFKEDQRIKTRLAIRLGLSIKDQSRKELTTMQ